MEQVRRQSLSNRCFSASGFVAIPGSLALQKSCKKPQYALFCREKWPELVAGGVCDFRCKKLVDLLALVDPFESLFRERVGSLGRRMARPRGPGLHGALFERPANLDRLRDELLVI